MSVPTSTAEADGTASAAVNPAAAKAPVAVPAATWVTVLLAIGIVALGVIAGRDALIIGGAITGTQWITAALHFVDGLTAQTWMLPAGAGLAVIGLLLLVAAVKPRRRTHRQLQAADSWITPRDVVRLAQLAAQQVTGVTAATVTGSARTITATVTPAAGFDTAAVSSAVTASVTRALEPLAKTPRLKIRFKEQDPS